jgi:hypothetical protein
MSTTDTASALRVQRAFLAIQAHRRQIAEEIHHAAVNIGSDIDMADDIKNLRSWLEDGTAPLADAIRGAGHMLCAAEDDSYERRIVPHPVAAP